MDIYEAIGAMREQSGVSYERMSGITGVDACLLQEGSFHERELRLDEFCRVVDACGYRLVARCHGETFAIRAEQHSCVRSSNVSAAHAMSELLRCAGMTPRGMAKLLGRPPEYVSRIIRNYATPTMSVFVSAADVASCELRIRRFHESYVLERRDAVGRPEPLPRLQSPAVKQRPVSKERAKAQPGRFTEAHVDEATHVDNGIGMTIFEAFKSYSSRVSARERKESS